MTEQELRAIEARAEHLFQLCMPATPVDDSVEFSIVRWLRRIGIPDLISALKAERAAHKRAVEALRNQFKIDIDYDAGRSYVRCPICHAWWCSDNDESHDPVTLTIGGVETTGPCPAAPWKEEL